jgi:hypothetical protein
VSVLIMLSRTACWLLRVEVTKVPTPQHVAKERNLSVSTSSLIPQKINYSVFSTESGYNRRGRDAVKYGRKISPSPQCNLCHNVRHYVADLDPVPLPVIFKIKNHMPLAVPFPHAFPMLLATRRGQASCSRSLVPHLSSSAAAIYTLPAVPVPSASRTCTPWVSDSYVHLRQRPALIESGISCHSDIPSYECAAPSHALSTIISMALFQ